MILPLTGIAIKRIYTTLFFRLIYAEAQDKTMKFVKKFLLHGIVAKKNIIDFQPVTYPLGY
jgi:hypothetical protein